MVYDVIIIGGGPAGMAAAVYAARKHLKTLLVAEDIGGQVNLTLRVENYLGYQLIEGAELMDKFSAQVRQYPIDQKIGSKVARVDHATGGQLEVTLDSGERYSGWTVVFATGKRSRPLNVPGEAEFVGRGVSYCEICDGPLFAGRRVAVIGGGNSALEAVLDMIKIAEHVSLITLAGLTCDPILLEKTRGAPNLTLYPRHTTERIEGTKLVEAIVIRDPETGEQKRLPVSGVFVEIGLVPNSDAVKHLVPLNEVGEVPVNCSSETSVPGLYAAGDVTTVPEKQILVAAGEGVKAVLQAHRYLQRMPPSPGDER